MVEGFEGRKVHLFVVFDIIVSVCADIAGAETQDGGTPAEPADMAVAVSGHSDGADMAPASRSAHADGSFRTVGEQIVRDQDIAGGMSALLRARFNTAVTVFDGVADKIDILRSVGINGKTGVIQAVAVGDSIAEYKTISGIVDTGGSVSVISRKADCYVACVVEAVAHDIHIADIGCDGDCFRPSGLAVFNIVAEQKDIGDCTAASSHEKDGVGTMVFTFRAWGRDVVDIEVTDYDMMGSGFEQDGAGIASVRIFDFKSRELYIGTAIQPEHGGTVLILIMSVEPRSIENNLFAGGGRNRDICIVPAVYPAVDPDLPAIGSAAQIECVSGTEAVDHAL